MEGGEVVEADHSLERFARCAGELGQPTLAWQARFFRAGRLLFAARLDEAEPLARETLDLGLTSGQQDARLIFLFEQFLLAYDRGRLDDLESDLAEGADSYNRLPALQAMLALAYCEAGRDSQARATFEQLADQGFDVSVNVTWFVATTVAAQVAAHLGDSARAEVLYDLLRPYPHRLAFLASAIFGSVAHHLGVLATAIGRLDEAEDYFAAAEAVHEQAGAPTWLARTRLEWARMLLSRAHDADRERAAQLLAPALATARQQRLPKLERQAVGLLGDCR
jgi:tetratricopeptide (TPR) repeat protein